MMLCVRIKRPCAYVYACMRVVLLLLGAAVEHHIAVATEEPAHFAVFQLRLCLLTNLVFESEAHRYARFVLGA